MVVLLPSQVVPQPSLKFKVFSRVPHPLPWFIVEVYDTVMSFETFENHRGRFLFRKKLSLAELCKKWTFDEDWLLNQGYGEIVSRSHFSDFWIIVKAYPGYLSFTRRQSE